MKRLVLALLIAALLLAGCGGDSSDGDDPAVPTGSQLALVIK